MKILSLDFGQKRIGMALSEDKTVTTFGHLSNFGIGETIAKIGEICRREGVEKIIIGIPKRKSGFEKNSFQTDITHKFALEIAKNLAIPIDYVDESFSSKEAERILGSRFNPRSKKYKEEIDKLSAQLILEQYLAEQK